MALGIVSPLYQMMVYGSDSQAKKSKADKKIIKAFSDVQSASQRKGAGNIFKSMAEARKQAKEKKAKGEKQKVRIANYRKKLGRRGDPIDYDPRNDPDLVGI